MPRFAAKACKSLLAVLCTAAGFLGGPPALAAGAKAPQCDVMEEKICDVRKFSWCGPIDLNAWVTEDGKRHCQSATVELTPTNVLPSLRRIRCYFYGSQTDVVFDAENYAAVLGPNPGDRIPIRNGVGEATIFGEYRNMSEESVVIFRNVGPSSPIILKCNGYGPA